MSGRALFIVTLLTATGTLARAETMDLVNPAYGPVALAPSATLNLADARVDDPATTDPATTATAPAAAEPPKDFFSGWKGNVELGANGSAGNSENLSIRGGIGGKRVTEHMETTAKLDYGYANNDGKKTKSRGQFEARNDWFLKDSKWSIFALGRIEYDELQDWDWRLSAFVGPGYTFIKNEKYLLRGRVGAGVTKEIGGSRNELIPEGLVGADFDWQITKNTKFFSTAEVYPSLQDFSEYRALARAGIEVLLDESAKLTLKLGVEDRYQSEPGPSKKKNDVDYFAVISWNF
jgi:putative salt-induced outer membrane protein YdiY